MVGRAHGCSPDHQDRNIRTATSVFLYTIDCPPKQMRLQYTLHFLCDKLHMHLPALRNLFVLPHFQLRGRLSGGCCIGCDYLPWIRVPGLPILNNAVFNLLDKLFHFHFPVLVLPVMKDPTSTSFRHKYNLAEAKSSA